MHRHEYVLIDKTVTDSQAEILFEMGLRPNTHTSFTKKYVSVFQCRICNKLKVIKVTN